MFDLIYCAGNNEHLSQIASEEGWLLGMRSGASLYGYPTIIDINYKKHPDFERHLDIVAARHPKYAVVPDLASDKVSMSDIERALRQYERLVPYCMMPLIVPKLPGQIALLPDVCAIGYSVPSRYGGASILAEEMRGRRIHLLGGSPGSQIQAYLHLSAIATVTSADCNMHQKMAICYAKFWHRGAWMRHPRCYSGDRDLYKECWRLSCAHIREAWRRIAISI